MTCLKSLRDCKMAGYQTDNLSTVSSTPYLLRHHATCNRCITFKQCRLLTLADVLPQLTYRTSRKVDMVMQVTELAPAVTNNLACGQTAQRMSPLSALSNTVDAFNNHTDDDVYTQPLTPILTNVNHQSHLMDICYIKTQRINN